MYQLKTFLLTTLLIFNISTLRPTHYHNHPSNNLHLKKNKSANTYPVRKAQKQKLFWILIPSTLIISAILYYHHYHQKNHKVPEELFIQLEKLNPNHITKHLNKYVISQHEAKKKLAIRLSIHADSIQYLQKHPEETCSPYPKTNILMIGPPGSGKTLISEQLGKIADLPFASIDCTIMSSTSYVGPSIQNEVATQLLKASKGNIKLAEQGIVLLDELGKLGGNYEHKQRDISGKEVQNELLTMLQGTYIEEYKTPYIQEPRTLRTHNMCFIAAGAFADLMEELNQKRKDQNNESLVITTALLEKYGIIPEIIRRLPIRVELHPLNTKELVQALNFAEKSVLKEYQALFKHHHKELSITKEGLMTLVQKGYEPKLGVSSLEGPLSQLTEPYLLNINNYPKHIVIDKQEVETLFASQSPHT